MKIISKCTCGEEYVIETNSETSCRSDGKRIYPVGCTNEGLCVFRCHKCGKCVDETVKGAEFDNYK
jgi:hypothetical protein